MNSEKVKDAKRYLLNVSAGAKLLAEKNWRYMSDEEILRNIENELIGLENVLSIVRGHQTEVRS